MYVCVVCMPLCMLSYMNVMCVCVCVCVCLFVSTGNSLSKAALNLTYTEVLFIPFKIVTRSERPKLMYIIPNGSNPTGETTSLEKRRQIYALARKYDFIIVEDDSYYFMQFSEVSASMCSVSRSNDHSYRDNYTILSSFALSQRENGFHFK